MGNSVLEARQISCNRGNRQLFSGLSVELESSKLLKLVGPNGSGKSSLLRILAGLLFPGEGGVVNSEVLPFYLGHDLALKDALTVSENIRFDLRLGSVSEEAVSRALSLWGMADNADTLVQDLSQGQKKKAALSKLSLTDARLWILDEPYVSLDTASCRQLDCLIERGLSDAVSVIVATHNETVLNRLPGATLMLQGEEA